MTTLQVINTATEIVEKGNKLSLWPANLNDKQRQQLAYISSQYGLDPFFSEMTVLGGNPYITNAGLLRVAHEDKEPPVSIQLELIRSDEMSRHFEYMSKLWKKSTPDDRPFVEYGEASPKDVSPMISKTDKDIKAMARTRAVNRVIRIAYRVSLTSAEELSEYVPDEMMKNITPKTSRARQVSETRKATKKSEQTSKSKLEATEEPERNNGKVKNHKTAANTNNTHASKLVELDVLLDALQISNESEEGKSIVNYAEKNAANAIHMCNLLAVRSTARELGLNEIELVNQVKGSPADAMMLLKELQGELATIQDNKVDESA